jgi:dTMP kinase
MIEGLLIAIEGIDGAGTTTQTRLLADTLAARGLPIHTTREPSDGPVGVLIRQMLTGRVVVPGIGGARAPRWPTMALLFAADRVDHLDAEVIPNLMDGVTVITDRYDYSSVAYQSLSAGGDREETIAWVRTLNAQARRPDLTIVLDVDPDNASIRRQLRSGSRELFEEEELQVALATFYKDIDRHFPGDNIVHVDGNVSMEETAEQVHHQVKVLRREV